MQKILSLKPNSQTLRRSADRKADHALRLIFLKGESTMMEMMLHGGERVMAENLNAVLNRYNAQR